MGEAFESRVRRTGQKLFQLMGDEVPPLFHKESWTGKVLAQCAKDEGFKTDFLRFVNVLPSLKQTHSVAEHLIDYFGRPEQHIPQELKLRFTRMSLASLKRAESIPGEIQEMMKRFMVAAAPAEALPALSDFRARGMAFSADILGEAVVSEAEADACAQRYLELMNDLGRVQEKWRSLGDSDGDAGLGVCRKSQLLDQTFFHVLADGRQGF